MSMVKGHYIICKKYHFYETPLGGPSNLTCCILYFLLLFLGEQLLMYLKIIEILKKCASVTLSNGLRRCVTQSSFVKAS